MSFVYTSYIATSCAMFPIEEVVRFVHGQLGGIARESFVSQAVACELQARGFCVEREACIPVWYTASTGSRHRLGVLQADLVVSDSSSQHIVEFKITPDTPSNRKAAIDQLQSYLRWSTADYQSATVVFYPKRGSPTFYSAH